MPVADSHAAGARALGRRADACRPVVRTVPPSSYSSTVTSGSAVSWFMVGGMRLSRTASVQAAASMAEAAAQTEGLVVFRTGATETQQYRQVNDKLEQTLGIKIQRAYRLQNVSTSA